jgi:glycosyltransferase involved in cell wall biosynthesis
MKAGIPTSSLSPDARDRPSSAVSPTVLSGSVTQGRLSPCPCGSGRRRKDCCGNLLAAARAPAPPESIRQRALTLQRGGRFAEALLAYDQALALAPDDLDVRHMRAVTLYQLGCIDEATATFSEMAQRGQIDGPAMWSNFGLALSQSLHAADDPACAELHIRYLNWCRVREQAVPEVAPRLSVVLASYNHARFVEQALLSVFAQTLLPSEIIVIDDGSTDGTPDVIEQALHDAPCPVRWSHRPNRGAAETLNEAIDIATGDWIAVLNSDDYYAADRLQHLVSACCRDGLDWGFGHVSFVDSVANSLDDARHEFAANLRASTNAVAVAASVGLSFLRANPAVSTGNLFFRKRLWNELGGFDGWRYHHDWSFAYRASLLSEPVLVPAAEYWYRYHEHNTISEGRPRVWAEFRAVMQSLLQHAVSRDEWTNPFAPTAAVWGRSFLATVAGVGALELLPDQTRRDMWAAMAASRTAASS